MASLFLTIGVALAQKTVKGVVVSAEDNEGIPGASIRVKGTTSGISTNIEGKFTLTVPNGAKFLIVSSLGYKTQEVAIKPDLRIVMQSEVSAIDELVVTAYGVQKKESFVGAQVGVDAKNLAKRPITNVTNALGGLTPGVQLTLSTGQPGAGAAIRVRGFGSVNAGSAPIYVVDGAVYDGSIADLNPADIQSLNILKDAASTAIYGASAGNGVVLITTKSGAFSAENKPSFTFTMNQGFSRRGQDYYETIGVMDHFQVRWQQWFNDYRFGILAPAAGDSEDVIKEKLRQAGALAATDVLTAYVYNPFKGIQSYYEDQGGKLVITKNPVNKVNPVIVMPDGSLNPEINGLLWGDDLNWEDQLFRTGHRQDYNFGGGYNTRTLKSYFSIGYLSEDGYRVHTGFKRLSGRANLSFQATKWLEVGTNLSYSNSQTDEPKTSSGGYNSNSFNFVRNIAPFYPVHLRDRDGNPVYQDGKMVYDYGQDVTRPRPYSRNFNPVLEGLLDKSVSYRDAINTRTFVKLTPLEGLTLTGNLSYDMTNSRSKVRYNSLMGDQIGGYFRYGSSRFSTMLANQIANYHKTVDSHEFDFLLGHESYALMTQSMSGTKKKESWPGVDELSNYNEVVSSVSQEDNYRKESYFGRVNYSYDGRYNASVSFRRDGSSRFHPEKRWGNFWSLGLGWNLHREDFIRSLGWVNELKLRGSIGVTGNDAVGSYYAFRTTYSLGNNNDLDPGVRVGNFGNKDLIWEGQRSSDLALEFALFDRRFSGTVELFRKESTDLIFEEPLPISTGVGSITKNIGKVRNHGVELDFNFYPVRAKDFYWKISANATIIRNKLLTLPEINRKDGIEDGDYKYLEGYSIYDYYLKEFLGVDPSDGRPMYRIDVEKYKDTELMDPNSPDFAGIEKTGEKATWTKNSDLAGKHFAGSAIPDVYGGFGTEIGFKNFDLNVAFSYQIGGLGYDGGYAALMGRDLNGGTAMHVDLKNAWMKEGQITDVPRLDVGDAGRHASIGSDRFLTSRTALMLRSVSLGYTFPREISNRLGLGTTRVSLAGENLFMWTKRKGFNPMTGFSGSTGAAGYGYAKTITASLTFSL